MPCTWSFLKHVIWACGWPPRATLAQFLAQVQQVVDGGAQPCEVSGAAGWVEGVDVDLLCGFKVALPGGPSVGLGGGEAGGWSRVLVVHSSSRSGADVGSPVGI